MLALCVRCAYICIMDLKNNIYVRVTNKEKLILFKAAKKMGLTPSQLIRQMIANLKNQN